MDLEKISQLTNQDITNIMNGALFIIRNYFMYFLPGFITIWLNNFIKGSNTEINKKTILIYFIVSYIYNLLTSNQIVIMIIAILVPFILKWFRKLNDKYDILGILKIDTSLSDNILDYIKSLETDENNGITLRVYLNTEDIMYEGKLRAHELRQGKEQLICLSGYREYYKDEDGNKICKKDYDLYQDKHRYWIIIKYNEIKKIEVVFESPK